MTRATIIGTGFYAPEKMIENLYFNERYGRDIDTFLREQRHIFQRRWMSEDQATSDLILPAAKQALEKAKLEAADLDLIIVATDTPDYVSPSTSAVVQHKLVARRAGTFDLNSACAGFVTALDVASKYLVSDERYRNILVVGAYGMSKFFDWADYKVTSVFADGAGAAIVSRSLSPEHGILASHLITEGQYHDYMGIYAGGTRFPISDKTLAARQHLLQFTKRIPPETNATHWPRLTNAILDRINMKVSDVDHFFFTQINVNSIIDTMTQLKAPQNKAHKIMDRYGYTGSACIPMAIADLAEKHLLREGDLVMLLGSGGGMSMAAMALRWSYQT